MQLLLLNEVQAFPHSPCLRDNPDYWRKNLTAHDLFQLLMHVYQNISDQPKNNMECVKIYLFLCVNNKKSHMQYMPIYDLTRNILLLKEFAYDLPVEIFKLKLFQILQYFV